jgi:hypothetical protein
MRRQWLVLMSKLLPVAPEQEVTEVLFESLAEGRGLCQRTMVALSI